MVDGATGSAPLDRRKLAPIIQSFIAGKDEIAAIEGLGDGNINDTYLVRLRHRPSLVIQRLNSSVFPDPICVADNVAMVTDFLSSRQSVNSVGCGSYRFPAAVPSKDGQNWVEGQSGGIWRCLTYIDKAVTYPKVERADQPFEAGKLLGCFHTLLEQFDGSRLGEALPGFHDLQNYKRSYLHSIKTHRRSLDSEFRYCREMVEKRLNIESLDTLVKEAPGLMRVIHGDPKCDNFLFDPATDRAVSIIDLDTVSSGLLAVDLGDCLRSFCNSAGEKGHSGIAFDAEICASVLAGYFQSCHVAQDERFLIYHGVRQLTYELGLRFFTDHLNDDSYFKVTKEGENLHRAGVQFKLLESIEKQRPAIEKAAGLC